MFSTSLPKPDLRERVDTANRLILYYIAMCTFPFSDMTRGRMYTAYMLWSVLDCHAENAMAFISWCVHAYMWRWKTIGQYSSVVLMVEWAKKPYSIISKGHSTDSDNWHMRRQRQWYYYYMSCMCHIVLRTALCANVCYSQWLPINRMLCNIAAFRVHINI